MSRRLSAATEPGNASRGVGYSMSVKNKGAVLAFVDGCCVWDRKQPHLLRWKMVRRLRSFICSTEPVASNKFRGAPPHEYPIHLLLTGNTAYWRASTGFKMR